ncbi:MAG: ferredoxin:thioredoxin reductase [Phycisphaerae bacterium]|nr:ferredoxin:thioredoxin reductase [Phycisphaerae bacterium]
MSATYEQNLRRLSDAAAKHGLVLNPDEARVQKVVGLMAENYDAVGEWVCPCKQQHKPAQKGMDKICPCPEWLDEIAKDGHCFCRLFFAQV